MPTYVQGKGGYTNSAFTNATITFDSATVSGNTIIVLGCASTSGTLTCSDNKGNTYSAVISDAGPGASANKIVLFIATNITGGASHTVTISSTGSLFGASGAAMEINKCQTLTPTDASAYGPEYNYTGSSLATPQTTNSITLTASDFVVSFLVESHGRTCSLNSGSPWSAGPAVTGTNWYGNLYLGYAEAGAGAITCSFNVGTGATSTSLGIAGFKLDAAATTAVPVFTNLLRQMMQ